MRSIVKDAGVTTGAFYGYYKNFDEFKLILTCSEGTPFENMIHDIVEIEVNVTHGFASNLKKPGYPECNVDPQLEHMLCSGLFFSLF